MFPFTGINMWFRIYLDPDIESWKRIPASGLSWSRYLIHAKMMGRDVWKKSPFISRMTNCMLSAAAADPKLTYSDDQNTLQTELIAYVFLHYQTIQRLPIRSRWRRVNITRCFDGIQLNTMIGRFSDVVTICRCALCALWNGMKELGTRAKLSQPLAIKCLSSLLILWRWTKMDSIVHFYFQK